MRQSLNGLPVRHEYAPGAEPSFIETAIGFFSQTWGAEQVLAFIGGAILALFIGHWAWRHWTGKGAGRSDSRPEGYGSLGESLGILRRERMPRVIGGGSAGWQAPEFRGGRLATHAPERQEIRRIRRQREPLLLDESYLAKQ